MEGSGRRMGATSCQHNWTTGDIETRQKHIGKENLPIHVLLPRFCVPCQNMPGKTCQYIANGSMMIQKQEKTPNSCQGQERKRQVQFHLQQVNGMRKCGLFATCQHARHPARLPMVCATAWP
eukprot:354470-Chlamydomonas_euryale.AAC.53